MCSRRLFCGSIYKRMNIKKSMVSKSLASILLFGGLMVFNLSGDGLYSKAGYAVADSYDDIAWESQHEGLHEPVPEDAGRSHDQEAGYDTLAIRHAERFDITYHETYKVIHLSEPWPDAEREFEYVLYERGTERPSGYEGARFIETPAEDLVCLASACISFAIELDLLDRLQGVARLDDVSHPQIREGVREGGIKEVGRNQNVNVELVMNMAPVLVGTFGVGMDRYDSHPKLMEAGIPVALLSQYMEHTPLGRAEWIRFLAAFFDLDEKADRIFRQREQQYKEYKALTEEIDDRPTVLSGKNQSGTWWLPGGDDYMVRFYQDAGGEYIWQGDQTGSRLQLDFEVVYNEAADADFWIVNVGSWESREAMVRDDDRYTGFRAYQQDRVYGSIGNRDGFSSTDFFEKGVARPHMVLKDLIRIFHPELLPDHERWFFRNL